MVGKNTICEHCEKEISTDIRLRYNTGGLHDVVKTIPFELAYKCKYCDGYFCEEHRLPENHSCIGLELWKTQRQKKVFKSNTIRQVDNTRWWEK